ncbi:multidrug effflux MFS transporter [Glaciecola petra]|uniref:Bcr/CflA family efflux transporter n=1 Tax=Glaciecola petra TaxID=3075602 RepID=A0ABU2ZR46_9ALTE|nr:multidrug effflux MFS transporter [Aestuariibacter sp. P117]MDT0595113.1 multidrug effflux MFS transporter [Aestuariibacter sp. P117]
METPKVSVNAAAARLPLVEFILLMALMTSLVALSIDAMLPALDTIGDELNSASNQQTYLIISIFFFGMAFGQVFFGPFADARGRRLTIVVGLLIFLFGTAICYFAKSMEVLLIGRVIQAFGVSGPRVASMALVRDLYVGDAMARVMSFTTVIFILVPMIAPLVGQLVMGVFGWRHIFTVFAIVALITAIWFFSRQKETLPRAQRVKFNFSAFFDSIIWLLKQPAVMGPALGMGLIFGSFLAYLSGSQTIFQSIYDTGEYFPLLFATLAFAIGAASFFNGMMVVKIGMIKLVKVALVLSMVFGMTLTLVGLLFSGVPPLWLFIVVMFFGFFFLGVLFGNLNALAMVPVGHIAGVGAAFIGSFSSILAVPIALLINMFLSDTIMPIAYGFLVFSIATYLTVSLGIKYTPSEG